MAPVSDRNLEKYHKILRGYIPVRSEIYLKCMGITDIKEMVEEDEWMMVTVIAYPEIIIGRKYELIGLDYINTKGERVTADLSETYGFAITKEQFDEILDNAVLLD